MFRERQAVEIVLEIQVPAFGVREIGGDIGAVEADATGDIAEQHLPMIRTAGGLFVVFLHGEGHQGAGDMFVGEGEAAVLGYFL